MKTLYLSLLVILLGFVPAHTKAQSDQSSVTEKTNMWPMQPVELKMRKFYVGSALDGAIFSTTLNSTTPGTSGTVRFTWFLNTGITLNYDFNKTIGLYSGLDIKNIGFIEKIGGYTVKHRTYNIGVPLGLKLGNLKKRTYAVLGGGVDFPINYKEKVFITRSKKYKMNEWFSDRTEPVMPYVFVGVVRKMFSLKFQYYPTNYMNPDFVDGATKPYAGYDVHPFLISLGMVMPYSKGPVYKKHMYHRHRTTTNTTTTNML